MRFAIALTLLVVGCTGPALKHARTMKAVNVGHARDKDLPRQAREIAQDNADAWDAQIEALGGEE